MADITVLTSEARIIAEARIRVSETDAYHAGQVSRYRKLHGQYAPLNGDQWPNDRTRKGRNGKIHLTSNLLKPAVDIGARLEAKLPRITLKPNNTEDDERQRAEHAEKGMMAFLEASGWKIWMHDLARVKRLYGKAVLKVFWNKKDRRPDVILIQNPANLRIGWGSSDFEQIDWAMYEYALSPFEVMRRWPDVQVSPTKDKDQPLAVTKIGGDHADPLNQRDPAHNVRPHYEPSDYERKQVKVWDYWYKEQDGSVCNAIIIGERVLAEGPSKHRELADIPYIVIENDHEPGSPEGLSSIEHLIDLQEEINRLLSQGVQLIVDNLDPAWQVDDDSVRPGLIPRAGEVVAAGENKTIRAIEKPVNEFPIVQMLGALMDQYHKVSGLNPIMFGDPTGSQVSGRALAVMIDAYANRGEPSRDRMYAGLRDLLIFWTIMLEKLDPKIDIDGEKRGLKEIFNGYRRWHIIGPEITPKDVAEHTTNEINKVNAKIQSLRTAMDALGIDAPEDELDMIAQERTDLNLFPGDVQVQMAVFAALQQLGITAEQLQAGLGNQPDAGGAMQNDAQRAQPALGQDANEAGAQPVTAPGGIPPGGVGGTSLVRSTATQESQALNQLRTDF